MSKLPTQEEQPLTAEAILRKHLSEVEGKSNTEFTVKSAYGKRILAAMEEYAQQLSSTRAEKQLCNVLFPSGREVGIQDKTGCQKQSGHLDSHVFQNKDGRTIEWEVDLKCTCGCHNEEGYPCLIYGEVPQQDKEAVAEKDLVGKDLDTEPTMQEKLDYFIKNAKAEDLIKSFEALGYEFVDKKDLLASDNNNEAAQLLRSVQSSEDDSTEKCECDCKPTDEDFDMCFCNFDKKMKESFKNWVSIDSALPFSRGKYLVFGGVRKHFQLWICQFNGTKFCPTKRRKVFYWQHLPPMPIIKSNAQVSDTTKKPEDVNAGKQETE